MSRLLYMPIIGAVVLMLGCWKQPSVEAGVDHRVTPVDPLSSSSSDVEGCSMGGHWSALLARATRGTLGGERSAHRRVRTNASPRL